MKKFIKTTTIFLVILFLLNKIPYFFLTRNYGNDYYSVKYEYFQKNKNKFNTIIFGSSRLYRQFKPSILDSVFKKNALSTFNLATPASFNLETYFLYENLLRNLEDTSIKYAFVELQTSEDIDRKNINSVRNYYWLNFENLLFAIRYVYNSKNTIKQKNKLVSIYLESYLYRTIDFSTYKILFKQVNNISFLNICENGDGFCSLDEELIGTGIENDFSRRLKVFLKDTTVLKERIKHSTQAAYKTYNNKYLNKIHLKKLNKLINLSKEKGIYLFLIIPPKLKEYKELYLLKNNLPDNHIIDISDSDKYPLLYRTEFSFDIGHLNEKGANLFTMYIANEIEQKQLIN